MRRNVRTYLVFQLLQRIFAFLVEVALRKGVLGCFLKMPENRRVTTVIHCSYVNIVRIVKRGKATAAISVTD